MKAVQFQESGLSNLRVVEVERPRPGSHDVLLQVVEAGVNPIDYYVVSSLNVRPMPHVPGAEFAGVVVEVGDHVSDFKPGDRVVVYNRVFDGSCDMCLSSMEHLCRNGGIMSVVTNGGWAEYVAVPGKNLVKIPGIGWETAASLPVSALTAYHALMSAGLRPGNVVVVFGASGNTGQFAVQLAKMMGAEVIAVTGKDWVRELGADYVVAVNEAVGEVGKLTGGRMADVVIDPLGQETWATSIGVVGRRGKWITFGQLTGGEVTLSIPRLYSSEVWVMGSTGGTRKELNELAKLSHKLKVRVDKEYGIDDARSALDRLFSKQRNGRVMLRIGM